MRHRIYRLLVNRQEGIRQRYHALHDGAQGIRKYLSWGYLLALNFSYYILRRRQLGRPAWMEPYEEKKLLLRCSESGQALRSHPGMEEYMERIKGYDVISFDLFDTLLFRPFSEPSDLFFFIGEKLQFMDFKRIRMQLEAEERDACRRERGHTEITLEAIWRRMERETGLDAARGMETELETERSFCYANPFMLEIFTRAKRLGKKIIVISDMYLPKKFLSELLEQNGFTGVEELYISGEWGRSKAAGTLYAAVKRRLAEGASVLHIGDNPHSDGSMAQRHGFTPCLYPNVNRAAAKYRPYDMSPLTGGAYRGVVNGFLYSGMRSCSMEYEYGFLYGGLFVLGYCSFIHDICRQNGIDKILFLSRDGDILKQVYDRLYPQEKTVYACWSRRAALKLTAEYNKYDYFRRFLYHKVNQNYTASQLLEAMELDWLKDRLPAGCSGEMPVTDKNAEQFRQFVEENWEQALTAYREQRRAAGIYYGQLLEGSRKACIVDIGWAGSGAAALMCLSGRVWGFSCELTGILAGTNTLHNTEPDAGETYLKSGRMVSYLYSQAHNRDLMKRHDCNRGYNLFWELLVSSPERQFLGFSLEGGEARLNFGRKEKNTDGIREIQRGILDFAAEYGRHFGKIPYMMKISGRDAYAPMLVASGNEERYLREIKGRFEPEENVT